MALAVELPFGGVAPLGAPRVFEFRLTEPRTVEPARNASERNRFIVVPLLSESAGLCFGVRRFTCLRLGPAMKRGKNYRKNSFS